MSQVELLPEVPAESPFQFQDHPIRTQIEGDTLWFVARDVCEALGIVWKTGKGAGNSGTLSSIPAEWQDIKSFLTLGGRQKLRVITEPAVYKLAFRSNKPEADAFTNWVASEVVPSIRKTGKFEATPTPSSPITPADQSILQSIVKAKVEALPIVFFLTFSLDFLHSLRIRSLHYYIGSVRAAVSKLCAFLPGSFAGFLFGL